MSTEILIIDDNADIRFVINELITDAGYKTRLAANYNQALSEIDKKLPDVAIIDVKLDKSDRDGIELLNHIKSKNKDFPNMGWDAFSKLVSKSKVPVYALGGLELNDLETSKKYSAAGIAGISMFNQSS